MRRGVAATLTSVAVRQAVQVCFGLVLARAVGPDRYALVAAASIYVVLAGLLLDQGLSTALVQRPLLAPRMAGAALTLSLVVAVALVGLTWWASPAVAAALHVPDLTSMLRALGAVLVVKAVATVPRAVLARRLRFTGLATSDVVGTGAGAVVGLVTLALGGGAFAFVAFVLATEAVSTVLVCRRAAIPRPNADLGAVKELLSFGWQVLATNVLAFLSSNADSLLVARFLGARDLALYSVAFRVLVLPVVLLGHTVNRVVFPVVSRAAGDQQVVARAVLGATQLLAVTAVPLMAWVACAAPSLVDLVLGPAWSPAIPLVCVLAVAGARESVFFLTPALLRGMGRVDLNLRFQVVSTAVQVVGVVIGLQFGSLGVAVGYTLAGFALTPVLLALQRHVAGVTCRQQLAAILPAVHASGWAGAAFLSLSSLTGGGMLSTVAGSAAFVSALLLVLATAHRRWLWSAVGMVRAPSVPVPRATVQVRG